MSSQEVKTEDTIKVENLPEEIEIDKTYTILQANPNYATHGFFKYPCKFIPEIPKWAINKYAKNNSVIFDPFAGSGTSLLEARLLGYDSFGTEIDPIAKKVTLAKSQNFKNADLIEIDLIMESFKKMIESNVDIEIFSPKINNLNHWFNYDNLRILGKLKTLIEGINEYKYKVFFEIIFLSIIKQVSNADDTSPKPYVSKKIIKTPPNALDKFKKQYARYYKMLDEYILLDTGKELTFAEGDALNTYTEKNADLAITSPPYINAFDYARTLRLENLWLETGTEESILESKSMYVGTEKVKLVDERNKNNDVLLKSDHLKTVFDELIEIDERRAYIVKKFFEDMERNLKNVHKILAEDGKYVIVIGDSVIRKRVIESWNIIKEIALANNFSYVEHFSYMINNPYIRIPRSGRGGKINKDYVLVLQKNKI